MTETNPNTQSAETNPPPQNPESGVPPAAATAPRRRTRQAMPEQTPGVVSIDEIEREHRARLGKGFIRRPFGSQEQKLAFPARPGYHRHWFNDVGDRIKDAREAGYVPVEDGPGGGQVTRVVGTTADGRGITAHLMEIPAHWFEESQRIEQREVDAIDNAIRGGKIAADGKSKDDDKRYVPEQDGVSGIQFQDD